jgi:PAS domain S-box-containing protein
MKDKHRANAGRRAASPRARVVRSHADPSGTPAFWRDVVGALSDGVLIQNPVGSVLGANDALYRMVGFERDELVGASAPLPFWPAEETVALQATFEAALRGEVTERSIILCRKDGTRFPAIVHASRLAATKSRPPCVVTTLRDLTEQKRLEESLRQAAERWRAMTENPYDFVTIVDENYKYTYVNHTAPGIRREDLLRNGSPLDYLDADNRAVMSDAMAKAFRTAATTILEIYASALDQWFSTIVTPVMTDDRVTAVSLLTRNITKGKLAEQALVQSEHRLQLALAGGDVGVFDFDLETGTVFCSPRLFELFGYDASSEPNVAGAMDSFRDQVHPEDAERALEAVSRSFETGERFDAEYRVRRKDGTYGFFHVRGRSAKFNGKARFSGFITDNTTKRLVEQEREELEAQLRQVQKLDTLGRLAAGMAHDLNNLLVPILGNAQLLLTQFAPAGRSKDQLEDIMRAASRARDLVARILVFGRQSEELRTPVHVPDVVREALRFLQTSLPSNIEVAAEYDEGCLAVIGLPDQLQQAVLNLCANASHALAASGGRLTVKTEQFLVDDSFTRRHSMMRSGPAVRVVIEDNGPGMSAAILERAFEPFFTTKAPGEGSGLGLSIVHGIVTKHGGVVVATSRPGEGARFEIYLPSQGELAAPLPAAALEPARDPSAKKLRILCVDDEPAVLRVVTQVLRQEGHDVTAIASSREALQTLSAHPADFDLVITDQTMPELTGIELASFLYHLRRDIPVILLSGYAASESLNSATANVQTFLRKPFHNVDLVTVVQTVMRSH